MFPIWFSSWWKVPIKSWKVEGELERRFSFPQRFPIAYVCFGGWCGGWSPFCPMQITNLHQLWFSCM